MSLSSFSVPSGVAAGTAWAPQQGMPQPSIPQHPMTSGAAIGSRGVIGTAQPGRNRGDPSGDICTTIDVFGSAFSTATWNEENAECNIVSKRVDPLIRFSEEGRRLMIKNQFESMNLKDLSNDVLIGSSPTSFTPKGSCSPYKTFFDLDIVKEYNSVPVEPMHSLPLPLLLALLINCAAQLGPVDKGLEKPKKGKGKGLGKKRNQQASLTLVSPAGLNQSQRAVLLKASNHCDRSLSNIFNRGVAVVAGGLYMASRTAVASAGKSKGKVSMAGDLIDALRPQIPRTHTADKSQTQTHTQTDTQAPSVLYVHVYSICMADSSSSEPSLYYDAVLVRCEGRAGAESVGAPLCFERLCTVASLGGKLTSTGADDGRGILSEMKSVVGEMLRSTPSSEKEMVQAVILEGVVSEGFTGTEKGKGKGPVDRSCVWSDSDALSLLSGVRASSTAAIEVIRAQPGDAAIGGCVLSAAELSSSKEYLQREDEQWAIAYLLPVADGVLEGRDLGLRVLWSPSRVEDNHAPVAVALGSEDDIDNDESIAIFPTHLRLWKEDVGHIPPRQSAAAAAATNIVRNGCFKKSFTSGANSVTLAAGGEGGGRSSTHTVKSPAGWPRVQILERKYTLGQGQGSGEYVWRVLETLTPMLSCASARDAAAVKSAESVESCELEVRVNASTGMISATQMKGRPVSQAWADFWGRVQLVLVLILPFILIGLWYGSGYISEWYTTRQHTAWLLDFYQNNAPEKLKDPQYVPRTIAKYKGRMFLLWRNLERAYRVKWAPPHSVVEGVAEDLL